MAAGRSDSRLLSSLAKKQRLTMTNLAAAAAARTRNHDLTDGRAREGAGGGGGGKGGRIRWERREGRLDRGHDPRQGCEFQMARRRNGNGSIRVHTSANLFANHPAPAPVSTHGHMSIACRASPHLPLSTKYD